MALRRNFPIKRLDSEPLTRADLQYDLLSHIFRDDKAAFTDPQTTLHGDPPGTKVTFGDLYLNYLVRSPKCSKVLRDKMHESADFRLDFGMLSFLTNAGRINTTMAFFPEMRTALRTYHAVPALQRTDGNLQDAPRIKNALKAVISDAENISTPNDVLSRQRAGQVPSTSAMNLIFILVNHAMPVGRATHFEQTLDVLDIFTPGHYSSASRARCFLWLCYNYLESPSPNPFADEHAIAHPGHAPRFVALSPEEQALENVDTPEEIEYGIRMSSQRNDFLARQAEAVEAARSAAAAATTVPVPKEDKLTLIVDDAGGPGFSEHPPANFRINEREVFEDNPPLVPVSHDPPAHKASRKERLGKAAHPYSSPMATTKKAGRNNHKEPPPTRPAVQDRSMIEQAWISATTSDPLADSDEEGDHMRLEYGRRLQVIDPIRLYLNSLLVHKGNPDPTPTPRPLPEY